MARAAGCNVRRDSRCALDPPYVLHISQERTLCAIVGFLQANAL